MPCQKVFLISYLFDYLLFISHQWEYEKWKIVCRALVEFLIDVLMTTPFWFFSPHRTQRFQSSNSEIIITSVSSVSSVVKWFIESLLKYFRVFPDKINRCTAPSVAIAVDRIEIVWRNKVVCRIVCLPKSIGSFGDHPSPIID